MSSPLPPSQASTTLTSPSSTLILTGAPSPASTTLSLSSPTLRLTPHSPLTITTTHTFTTPFPIYALLPTGPGITIHSPAHRIPNRRIGPWPDVCLCDDDDEDGERGVEEGVLVRLEPGARFSTIFVLQIEGDGDLYAGYLGRAVRKGLIVTGGKYVVRVGDRRWRWMFEREVLGRCGEGADAEGVRACLARRPVVEWSVGCEEEFTAV